MSKKIIHIQNSETKGTNTMSNGRFGIHGGQYMPETLMNAVIELEEAYNHYKDDPEFNRELTELLNELCRKPVPPLLRKADDQRSWRSKDLFKTRRFKPYRRPQDQQRLRTGASCKKNGQNPCYCRDRSRTARCSHSHSSSPDGTWNAKSSWEKRTRNARH